MSERPFSREETQRYSRHLILPDFGPRGQKRLKEAKVLCVGAGGLGSPAAMYLAAAGVGTLGLVDFDLVDSSNLHRQVLHGTHDVGQKKVTSGRARLEGLNPHVRVVTHDVALTHLNALDILREYTVVLDGTDSWATRYLINDACVLLGRPLVSASVYRFEGQLSVFSTPGGPCYRCLYPEPPPPGLVSNCGEGGVLGVVPGVLGTLQATEVIKLVAGIGEPLVGRLLLFDALALSFREITVRRSGSCAVCGDTPTITALLDYQAVCGTRVPRGVAVPQWAPLELKARLERGEKLVLLDVREPLEREIAALTGGVSIPFGELATRHVELPRDQDVVVYCKVGERSALAVLELMRLGFRRVFNLQGGIEAWREDIDEELPTY